VVLRLIDGNGRPEVKLAASADGAGLLLLGATDDTQVKLGASHGDCSLMLQDQQRRQQVWKPRAARAERRGAHWRWRSCTPRGAHTQGAAHSPGELSSGS
jgi:hypothetical protein